MRSLNGKTALVTGASRGMGRASALALAAAGAQVLVHYGRGAKEADGVVAEIRKAGGRADAIATDLATADGPGKLAKQARSIIGDRLDILVANAGISKAASSTVIARTHKPISDSEFVTIVDRPRSRKVGSERRLRFNVIGIFRQEVRPFTDKQIELVKNLTPTVSKVIFVTSRSIRHRFLFVFTRHY